MRVITGSARGARLVTPEGKETRPTTDMVKEAMFSIIQFELEGAMVLDLFAGSGQLGIEALSRGARFAVFVDESRAAQEAIRENLRHTGLAKESRVAAMDAQQFLRGSKDTFDIALMDPPYAGKYYEEILPLLAQHMSEGGVILCESGREEILPEEAGSFRKQKEYRYGRIKLTAYRLPAAEMR